MDSTLILGFINKNVVVNSAIWFVELIKPEEYCRQKNCERLSVSLCRMSIRVGLSVKQTDNSFMIWFAQYIRAPHATASCVLRIEVVD